MNKRPLLKIESTYNDQAGAGIHVLSGKLFGDREGYGLLEQVGRDIEDGHPHVILDLSGVNMANSSGLGIMASIYNAVQKGKGSVTLVGPSERLKQGLEMIMIWNLVSHATTTEEALAGIGTR